MGYTVENVKDRIVKLNVGDWIAIQKWMKRQPIDDAVAATAGLPVDIQNAAIRDATQLSSKITVTSMEGFAILNSPISAAKLLHLTLEKSEKGLKFEHVAEQLDFESMQPILDYILEVNGFYKKKDEVKNEVAAES